MKNVPVQKRDMPGQAGQMPKACPVSRPDWGLNWCLRRDKRDILEFGEI